MNKEAIIRFAEPHENFAKAYVVASITDGHRERRDLLKDLGDWSSIAKSKRVISPWVWKLLRLSWIEYFGPARRSRGAKA